MHGNSINITASGMTIYKNGARADSCPSGMYSDTPVDVIHRREHGALSWAKLYLGGITAAKLPFFRVVMHHYLLDGVWYLVRYGKILRSMDDKKPILGIAMCNKNCGPLD